MAITTPRNLVAPDLGAPETLAPPVRALVAIGKSWDEGDLWNGKLPDYQTLCGVGPEHIPELISIATSVLRSNANDEEDDLWPAVVHAWFALGQLRAREAVEPLIGLLNFADATDLDWGTEQLPKVLAMIGEDGVAASLRFIEDDSNRTFARSCALNVFEYFVEQHKPPREVLAPWIAALSRLLEAHARNGHELNAFIVGALLNLKAVEAADVIERAFASGWVDEFVYGDWDEVRAELFDLPRPPSKPSEFQAVLNRLGADPPGLRDPAPGVREIPLAPASRAQKQWSKARKQRDRKRGKRR